MTNDECDAHVRYSLTRFLFAGSAFAFMAVSSVAVWILIPVRPCSAWRARCLTRAPCTPNGSPERPSNATHARDSPCSRQQPGIKIPISFPSPNCVR